MIAIVIAVTVMVYLFIGYRLAEKTWKSWRPRWVDFFVLFLWPLCVLIAMIFLFIAYFFDRETFGDFVEREDW